MRLSQLIGVIAPAVFQQLGYPQFKLTNVERLANEFRFAATILDTTQIAYIRIYWAVSEDFEGSERERINFAKALLEEGCRLLIHEIGVRNPAPEPVATFADNTPYEVQDVDFSL